MVHGFTREAVEEAMENISDTDWEENCAAAIRKKYGEIPEDRGERQKLIASMMRLVYDTDTIKEAMRAILREN
jgi:SOS response regulatory protein OraA/RecX